MSYIYNLTDTWDAGATTFAGIKMAVTNTASGASSKLLDLTVSGATTGSFSVDKSGNGAFSGLLTVGAGTVTTPSLSTTADSNTGLYFPSADTLAFVTNGDFRLRVDSTGNINVGSGAVLAGLRTLDVQNADTAAGSGCLFRLITQNVAGSGTTAVNFVKYKNGTFAISNSETDAAANISFSIGGPERMRIGSSGNVGVGTTNLTAKLTVQGVTASQGFAMIGDPSTFTPAGAGAIPNYGVGDLGNTAVALAGFGGLRFYTQQSERLRIASDGTIGVNATNLANVQLTLGGTAPTSGATSFGIYVYQTVPAATTSTAAAFFTNLSTAAASFTCASFSHFNAAQGTIGAGSTVTNQYGFIANSNLIGATNNFGFYANIPSGAGRYNFYAAGGADNLFSGNVLVFGAGGLGYTTGSGGAVTQTTSRSTGVTLDKTNGAITLVSAAGSTTATTFTVTNSTVAATDVIHICQKSGTDKYIVLVTNVAAGSFQITFYTTGGTTTEQPVFNFAILKSVAA